MKKNTTQYDSTRAAYMIAWRDRYIERLQERLAGREEENEMLSTLLFYALGRQALESEARSVPISVREISALLGHWQCHTEVVGEDYVVHFTKRAVEADGKESKRE